VSEIEEIKERYERRKSIKKEEDIWFAKYTQCERELKYFEILKINFENIASLKIMEIGSGGVTTCLQ